MSTVQKKMAGYVWFAFSGISGVVGYYTIQGIDSDQKRHIDDDINYLRRQRAYYETTQQQFRGTETYEHYGDLARFTQEEIDAREQWKQQHLLKRTFGEGLYMSDAITNIERRAGEQTRIRNNIIGTGANTRVGAADVAMQNKGLQTVNKD
jgi:hypothetical protein